MIEGDWNAVKDQVRAEIKDKAPLVALAYTELKRECRELGEKPSTFDLAVVAELWVNMICGNVEDRIKEMMEEGR